MVDHRDDHAEEDPEDRPESPVPDQAEIDRRWDGIVAGLGPLGIPDSTPRDRQEGTPGGSSESSPDFSRHVTQPPHWGPRDYTVDDEEDGAFVPPDPPALGSGRPAVVLSAAGLAGAPLALLLATLFWPGIPGIVVTILITVMVAGGVGLFLALPRDTDRSGPWNGDGAQV